MGGGGGGRGGGGGAEDAGKYRASLAICRKALIPRWEERIVKNLEFSVRKKDVMKQSEGRRQRDTGHGDKV